MFRIRILATLTVAVGVGACAPSMQDIGPSYVSPVIFQNWTCEQLAEEGHRLIAALEVASRRQDQAQSTDAVGVLLVGLPLGSMTGQNIAPEIGRLKGEHETVYRVGVSKGCQVQR